MSNLKVSAIVEQAAVSLMEMTVHTVEEVVVDTVADTNPAAVTTVERPEYVTPTKEESAREESYAATATTTKVSGTLRDCGICNTVRFLIY